MTATEALIATRDVSSSCQDVWDVIANGWTYAQWVVGNSRTRAVDDNWPEPGASIQHSIGVWPLVINDETLVESCTPGKELVLQARLSVLGAARITLRLHEIADGCRIEMIEVPVEGPIKLMPDRLALAAVYPRNRECLWRLEALAKGRHPAEAQ
ncbi:SRPBCC family protein [Mycobacterium asiaticum]|uniref:Polyketide cyclase n=1 Tax=Mycobacterium asiaticum TaxID=1790 RepID=A0A1A3N885_MYCAS|nr:SRPBCC family protein [Mycobacterium asiaticum]OBK17274.1 hypothetical protein A5636_23140 [Mycobacterium asiaticum]